MSRKKTIFATIYHLCLFINILILETLLYCVAEHTLEISLQDPQITEEWIPSFSPFKIANGVKDLFSLTILSNEATLTEEGSFVTEFNVDGMLFQVYRLSNNGYRYKISNPKEPETWCSLFTNEDFSEGKAFLKGANWLKHYSLNNFLMLMYGFSSATKETLLFHSSVIEKDNKGYLFLGKSGTGKSTHSRLWLENIPDTSLLNDDNPVIRIIDGKAFVYGSPWSGKTPCYKNRKVEIGGIVRLKQYPANIIERQTGVKAYAALLPSISNMIWDKRVNHSISDTISSLASICQVFQLQCLPNAEAAELCFNTLSK